MSGKTTILTGDRPTGPLHLGHYVESLRQRATLQRDYQQFISAADLQGLTDNSNTPQEVRNNIPEVLADRPAVGIDPSLTTICPQSAPPALAELIAFCMNIVTMARVERNPTVKNEIAQKGLAHSLPVGFLVYPIGRAADVTTFKAEVAPIGDDQLPMIEQINEVVHKINSLLPTPVLSYYKVLLGKTSRLPGIDGSAKMLKSLGNTLLLSASEGTIHHAVSVTHIGSNHLKVSDPGQIDDNMVFIYLDAFHPDKIKVAEMKVYYQRGGLGDQTCKNEPEICSQELTAPIRERRATYIQDKGMLMAMFKRGGEQVHEITQQTLREMKQGLGSPVL